MTLKGPIQLRHFYDSILLLSSTPPFCRLSHMQPYPSFSIIPSFSTITYFIISSLSITRSTPQSALTAFPHGTRAMLCLSPPPPAPARAH